MARDWGESPAKERSEERKEHMNDAILLRILKDEEADAASYFTSELAESQADSMDRYHAKKYGDEVEGRSQVVTHDIEDTMNWIMPHMMRVFRESDELVCCDDPGLDDGDDTLKQAADYLHHVMFRDNDGEVLIHDFVFDGLLQKVGIVLVYFEDPEPCPPKEIEGLTLEQVIRYVQDPEYEILEADKDEGDGPEPTVSIKVQRTPRVGRVCVEPVPPEEFRISRRARSIKQADYVGWKRQVYLAEVLAEIDNPEIKAKLSIDGYATSKDDDIDIATDARLDARFPDEPLVGGQSLRNQQSELGRRKVWQNVEYIRTDVDGDGVMELRRICRIGDVIIDNDAIDECEFVAWSPIRVSHRLIGRSVADTLIDLQKIRTVLTRSALDSLSRSLMPRTIVNEQMLAQDGSTFDRLLDHDVGAVIPVRGDVNAAIKETATPDVSANALATIEYFDRKSEEASGVNKHAQGIAPEAITKTASGIEMLQAAANSRIEQVARWAGYGLEEIFTKILRLLVRHQDGPRQVKINGKRMEIDPRRWSDEMTVSVHVGSAESREKRLMGLNMLAQKQEIVIQHSGPSNPMVSVKELRATYAMMAESLGFKNPSRFFKEIPEDYQPPPPGPDPKMMEVQGKQQLAQADMQGKQQLAAAEAQHKAQMAQADLMHKQQLAAATAQLSAQQAEQKAASEREIAQIKLDGEMQMQAAKLAMEERLAVARMQQEYQLATMKMEQEQELAREALKAKASADNGSGGSFREGGRLDA